MNDQKFKELHLLTCLAEECGEVMKALYTADIVSVDENKDEIEYELNDLFTVADILKEEGFLSKDEVAVEKDKIFSIFEIVNEIQYNTHKAVRFGLDDMKPGGNNTNKENIEELLTQLKVWIKENDFVTLWGSNQKKKEKVYKFLDYALKKYAISGTKD